MYNSIIMEWTKEKTACLINLYKEKRVLWDPTCTDFKDRNKKFDAWNEIAHDLQISKDELEKKMKGLNGQFQRELKKGKSGDGPDAPYKTKWIFFNSLLFLKDKNEVKQPTDGVIEIVDDNNGLFWENSDNSTKIEKESHDLYQQRLPSVDIEQNQPDPVSPPAKRTKKIHYGRADEAYAVMKKLCGTYKKKDEFDAFGEYVAHTLRKLRNRTVQTDAKFGINNVLYQAEKNDQQRFSGRMDFTGNTY